MRIQLAITLMLSSAALSCPWGNEVVCGVDKIEYPSICALMSAYVELAHFGPCRLLRVSPNKIVNNCPGIYEPVCGKDGVTYRNECTCETNNMKVAYEGPCNLGNKYVPLNPPLICKCVGSPFSPTCSLDGGNYENECLLSCIQRIPLDGKPCVTPCNCPKVYDPVCGVDGLTYDNKCTLDCLNVTQQGRGECNSLLRGCQFCSKMFTPMCGADNKTYKNMCSMKCQGAPFQHFGECRVEDKPVTTCHMCGDQIEPICGSDGINYQNECQCTCQGTCKKYSEGSCPVERTCAGCAGIYEPVCGVNGKTYDNVCFLECSQVPLMRSGRC